LGEELVELLLILLLELFGGWVEHFGDSFAVSRSFNQLINLINLFPLI
jgi:hypothetical protein